MERLEGYYAAVLMGGSKDILYYTGGSFGEVGYFISPECAEYWLHENQLQWVSELRIDIDGIVDSMLISEMNREYNL